jgi:hypothetical protein
LTKTRDPRWAFGGSVNTLREFGRQAVDDFLRGAAPPRCSIAQQANTASPQAAEYLPRHHPR